MKAFFEQARVAIQIFNAQGECLLVNSAWEKLWNSKREDLAGYNVLRDPQLRALGLGESLERSFAGEAIDFPPVLYDPSQIGKAGRPRWVETTTHPILDAAGKLVEVAFFLRDITERKREEESTARRIRESEDFLDSVIENIPNMIFVKDAVNLRFLRFNRAGEELLGYSRADLIGKNDFDFFPREQAESFIQGDRRVIAGKTVVDIPEEPIETAQLGQRILHTKKIPVFDEHGEPRYLVGISEDITEHKIAEKQRLELIRSEAAREEMLRQRQRVEASEALLRLTTDALPVLIAYVDREERYQFNNRAYEDWLGFTPAQLRGRIIREVVSADLYEQYADPIQAALGGERVSFYSRFLHARSGAIRQLKVTLVPDADRENPGGRPRGFVALSEDVTDLQEAVQARDEFLSICSHELKTPITSLKLQTQIIARQLDREGAAILTPDRLHHFSDTIQRQIDRMARLIEDMLDVSRISTGRLSMEMAPLQMDTLVREVVERFSEQLKAARMGLSLNLAPGLCVKGDQYRLEQVVTNLLTNAMKYGEGKPVSISLQAVAGESGSLVELVVADQGIGIAPENLGRIFQRFERAVSSNNISGLGLGLYILKQIVEAHQGTVRVESKLHVGTRFFVQLPRCAN